VNDWRKITRMEHLAHALQIVAVVSGAIAIERKSLWAFRASFVALLIATAWYWGM
jgi:hypothetical protein